MGQPGVLLESSDEEDEKKPKQPSQVIPVTKATGSENPRQPSACEIAPKHTTWVIKDENKNKRRAMDRDLRRQDQDLRSRSTTGSNSLQSQKILPSNDTSASKVAPKHTFVLDERQG